MSTATKMPRIFEYNDITLTDPNPGMTPEQVKEFYAETYPELTQAVIEGPETTEGGVKYTFEKIGGTKGAVTVEQIAEGAYAPSGVLDEKDVKLMRAIALDISEKSDDERVMLPPPVAQGMI